MCLHQTGYDFLCECDLGYETVLHSTGNNREVEVLRRTTGKNQNRLGSNPEDISFNRLHQKMDEISYDNELD